MGVGVGVDAEDRFDPQTIYYPHQLYELSLLLIEIACNRNGRHVASTTYNSATSVHSWTGCWISRSRAACITWSFHFRTL